MLKIKRIAVINDLSCIGKCSLTVTIPIISALGIEVCPLPTAVLSAHTEFPNSKIRDLSDDLIGIAEHWKSLGAGFDCIYTGYIANEGQIENVISILELLRTSKTAVIVDPVMGDGGVLYNQFNADFPKKMVQLCQAADIILPNITEAAAMLEIQFKEKYDKEYIERLICGLRKVCKAKIVLTGIEFCDDEVGTALWDGEHIEYYMTPKISGRFAGTGDIFASVFAGAYIKGYDLCSCVVKAADFTGECIKNTMRYEHSDSFGVMFEDVLYKLIHEIGQNKQ